MFMTHFSIMKKATVADLRNNFRRISAWIEEGEAVAIVKRGKPFARLLPFAGEEKVRNVDFQAQRRRIWGRRVFSAAEVKAMSEAESEGEEG
jgi:antitoxin (DNA-binding transcriptional repressor) of toxin-antitoxin stability system